MKTSIKLLLKTIKEYTATIVAIVLFFASRPVIRWLEPTAGVYDTGVLQVIIINVIQFCIYMSITWTVVKNIWPAIGEYFKLSFNHDFKSLSPCLKVIISLSVYFVIFLLLVLLSRVI